MGKIAFALMLSIIILFSFHHFSAKDDNIVASNTTLECSINCGKGIQNTVLVMCKTHLVDEPAKAGKGQGHAQCNKVIETRPCIENGSFCHGTKIN